MDIKKFVKEAGLSGFPVGLGGCRNSGPSFDSCAYDLFVFDEKTDSEEIILFDDEFVVVHHASLSETDSAKLLQYGQLYVIQDESWDLKMMLSKIQQSHESLFSDLAKNCLIESQFCCQKTLESLRSLDVFGPCWQKCATFYLASAISAINHQRPSPSHMLDLLRNLKESPINGHLSAVTQTVGLERATPTLLERMLKSTVGFSEKIGQGGHSKIIKRKHDFFIENSMLSDCYFYLGYINKENFIKIKDTQSRRQDLIHILRVAFDVEADANLLCRQSATIQKSCNEILKILSGV